MDTKLSITFESKLSEYAKAKFKRKAKALAAYILIIELECTGSRNPLLQRAYILTNSPHV